MHLNTHIFGSGHPRFERRCISRELIHLFLSIPQIFSLNRILKMTDQKCDVFSSILYVIQLQTRKVSCRTSPDFISQFREYLACLWATPVQESFFSKLPLNWCKWTETWQWNRPRFGLECPAYYLCIVQAWPHRGITQSLEKHKITSCDNVDILIRYHIAPQSTELVNEIMCSLCGECDILPI